MVHKTVEILQLPFSKLKPFLGNSTIPQISYLIDLLSYDFYAHNLLVIQYQVKTIVCPSFSAVFNQDRILLKDT